MGFVQIPEEAEVSLNNRSRAIIELDSHELSQTVSLLQSAVTHITLRPSHLFTPQTHQSPSAAPPMATLKQKIGLMHAHNCSSSISRTIAIASPIGTPKTSSQPSTPRSGPCSIENLPSSISQGLGPLQQTASMPHSNDQVNTQAEQEISAGKIAPTSRESENKSPEELQATPRAERGSWDQEESCSGVCGLVRVPEQLSAWRRRLTTARAKHNKNGITAMCYVPSFKEIDGTDNDSGWLISSSEKLLNLWQCTSRSGVSEPSLQLKNSQPTEFVMEDMNVDMDAKILRAFCPHPQDKALCITVHSLGGPVFFKYQGMIRIPCEDTFVSRRRGIYGVRMMHLVSLQPIGGALSRSVAAAFGRNAFVYDLSSASANPLAEVPPKALWQAHDSPVSCMHQSSFVCALFTGAADGSIRLWDMKAKPSNPVKQYLHKKHVTGIETLDGTMICSSSIDGTIMLWDIRCGLSPFMSAIPDEKAILNMACLPSSNMIAFTTRGGLFCLQVANSNSMDVDASLRTSSSKSSTSTSAISSLLWPLTPLPSVGPCTGVKWNTQTGTEIYTSEPDGSITMFAR